MTQRQFAIAGLIAPLLFCSSYFILSSIRPEYSFLTKAISELGSIDAPNKMIWNCFGYIFPGLLISFFSFGLFKSISKASENKVPLIALSLSGIFMAMSGVFPGDFNDRQSTTMLLHTIASFSSYLFFLIAAFTYSRLMKRSDYWKKAILPTLSFAWLTILFGAWPFLFPSIPALGQRMVFFFYLLWVFYLAYKLYRKEVILKWNRIFFNYWF